MDGGEPKEVFEYPATNKAKGIFGIQESSFMKLFMSAAPENSCFPVMIADRGEFGLQFSSSGPAREFMCLVSFPCVA